MLKPDKYLLVWAQIFSKLDNRGEGVLFVYEIIARNNTPKPTLKRILEYGNQYSGFNLNFIWRNNTLIFSRVIGKVEKKKEIKVNKKETLKAEIKEGFTVEEIKEVIKIKKNEWLGTEMEKYLRPQTLFGNKFESYLNQSTKIKIHSKISNYGKTTKKRSDDFQDAIAKADVIDYSKIE